MASPFTSLDPVQPHLAPVAGSAPSGCSGTEPRSGPSAADAATTAFQSAVAQPPASTAYSRSCGTTTTRRTSVRPSSRVPRSCTGPAPASAAASQVIPVVVVVPPLVTSTSVGSAEASSVRTVAGIGVVTSHGA
ncbi:hypothetical protein ABID70_001471 [Clavibacter michiganensis]